MTEMFTRTEMLIGKSGLEKLSAARVAVFGIGGVGGYVVEALVRSGVGALDLIDNDFFSITNLNRQIYATTESIGKYKVDVAKERIKNINPNCKVNVYKEFFTPENSKNFDFKQYNYVADAIDTVAGKLELVVRCNEFDIPIISSMGAGNKMYPEMFEIADIYKTSVCPLAKVMRRELKKRKIKHLNVVYSKESPIKQDLVSGKRIPGSNAFVPATAGLIMAGKIVRDLIKRD